MEKKMNKKHLSITCLVILVITLACVLSGCRGENDIFNGKYEVTFNLNGGTLDYKTSSVNTEIKYAYVPNTYVIAVNDIPGYKLFKDGYVFSGWYTSEACNPGDEWDFDGKVLDFDGLVLYAGWERATVYSYTVYYTDGDTDVALGSYNVKAGAAFSDWRKFAEKRDGYTSIGYFSDRDCTTPWDSDTVHPGGEVDLDIPVYVNFIEGKWHLVSNMDQLADAVAANDNVYLIVREVNVSHGGVDSRNAKADCVSRSLADGLVVRVDGVVLDHNVVKVAHKEGKRLVVAGFFNIVVLYRDVV